MMTVVYTPESGGAPEVTNPPSPLEQDDIQNQNQQLPPSTSATSTAPSYSPIYSAAQPASMSSLPAATEAVTGSHPEPGPQTQPEPERSTSVYTPSETTNPTPATTTSSSPPPPQPGAVPVAGQGHGYGYEQGQAQVQGQIQEQGVPPPPKAGEVVAQGGVSEGAATATADPKINPGIQSPTQPYGYGYGYASQQQQQQYPQYQQPPNSTTTPYSTVYPRHPSMPTTTSTSYQSPYSNPYTNNNIMQDELDTGEKGFLDMAKGWMQTAGEKLVQVEAEVWRRINEAHDGDR